MINGLYRCWAANAAVECREKMGTGCHEITYFVYLVLTATLSFEVQFSHKTNEVSRGVIILETNNSPRSSIV